MWLIWCERYCNSCLSTPARERPTETSVLAEFGGWGARVAVLCPLARAAVVTVALGMGGCATAAAAVAEAVGVTRWLAADSVASLEAPFSTVASSSLVALCASLAEDGDSGSRDILSLRAMSSLHKQLMCM